MAMPCNELATSSHIRTAYPHHVHATQLLHLLQLFSTSGCTLYPYQITTGSLVVKVPTLEV